MKDSATLEVRNVLENTTVDVTNDTNGETGECGLISPLSEATSNRRGPERPVVQHNLMLSSTTRSLNYSPSTNVTARLPEDVSEALFCDGYDSDGKLPNIPDMEDDLQALEDYNNMPIG